MYQNWQTTTSSGKDWTPPGPGESARNPNTGWVQYGRDPSQDAPRPHQAPGSGNIVPFYKNTAGGIQYPNSPQDFYNWYGNFQRNMRNQYPAGTHWGWLQARMNPALSGGPGRAATAMGASQLAQILSDPYNIPEDRLRGMLEGTELAFNRAGQQVREGTLSSGAGRGGVARAAGDQVALARGAQQAQDLREWEQYRQQMGDQRLRSLLMPWVQAQNAAAGVAEGVPVGPQGGNEGLDTIMQGLMIAGLAMCWVAREVYGESDPRWRKARRYLLTKAPAWLLGMYLLHGEEVAQMVRDNPALKAAMRPTFDRWVALAQ